MVEYYSEMGQIGQDVSTFKIFHYIILDLSSYIFFTHFHIVCRIGLFAYHNLSYHHTNYNRHVLAIINKLIFVQLFISHDMESNPNLTFFIYKSGNSWIFN